MPRPGGKPAGPCRAPQDAVALVGGDGPAVRRAEVGEAAVAVGEGEAVGGVEVVLVLAVVPGRLGEADVEEAEPAAGDVGDETVEHLAAGLVNVEALVEELAQEPAALRHPEGVGPGDGRPAAAAERV